MQARFYAFSKRRNSTKIPASDEGVDRDIVLKKPTSLINPVIQTQTVNDGVNYVYIPEFARYYFVDDTIKMTNNVTEFHLSVDVLASMRAEILPKAAYVTRAYSQTDNTLTDTFYPTKSGMQQKKNYADFVPLAAPAFVVSAIGIDENAVSTTGGACRYYVMSSSELASLMKFIFDQTNYQDDIAEGVVKTFFNPSQYLVSCYFCPFFNDMPSGDKVPFQFGWWKTADEFRELSPSASIRTGPYTIKIPRPNEGNISAYENYAPYAAYRIYIPFYGMFDLDADLLKGSDTIKIEQIIDIPTGIGKIVVYLGNDANRDNLKILFMAEASVAASIPMAQSSMPINWDTAIAGTVKNVMGRFSTSEFEDTLSDIASLYLDVNRQVSVTGTVGCFSQRLFEAEIIVICDYKTQVEKNHALFGDPLCKAVRLSDMNGFVRCLSFNMQSYNYLQTECDQVNQYLNGGAYIE